MPDAREKVARWTGEARIGDLLLAHYRLRLEGAVPVGGVIRLDTRQGSFALKRAGEGGERRWREVEELGKHLFAAKAIRIPIPLRTRSGRLTFAGYVHNYVLLPWIAGKPIAFARPRDFQDVSRGLARLHEGARGFPLLSKGADIRASWIRLWEKAIQRMGLYRVAVEWSGRSVDVDSVLRDAAPYAEGMITNALQYLHRTQVDSLSPEVALQGRVCHGNLHGGNLLRDEQGSVRFIDWNRMAWDARARDVAQWLLYAYGRTGDLDLLGLLLQDYRACESPEGRRALSDLCPIPLSPSAGACVGSDLRGAIPAPESGGFPPHAGGFRGGKEVSPATRFSPSGEGNPRAEPSAGGLVGAGFRKRRGISAIDAVFERGPSIEGAGEIPGLKNRPLDHRGRFFCGFTAFFGKKAATENRSTGSEPVVG